MRNRTVIILVVAIAVVGCLILAAGATAFLGVTAFRSLPKISSAINLTGPIALAQDNHDREQGILVASVVPDSPADRAGIVRGDILMTANGEPLEMAPGLLALLQSLKPGDEVALEVLHGDELRELTITLEEGDSGLSLGITPCGPGLGTIFPRRMVSTEGAMVVEVVPGGPAEQAGLQAGDVITSVDGEPVNADNSFPDLLAKHQPGDEVILNIQRAGEESPEREFTVTLGEDPEVSGKAYLGIRYTQADQLEDQGGGMPPFNMPFEFSPDDMPFHVPDFKLPEGIESGVIVTDVASGSPAEAAGIQNGDVLSAIDGTSIETSDDLVKTIQAHEPGDQVTLTVLRIGQEGESEIEATLGENPDKAGVTFLGVTILDFSTRQFENKDLPSLFDKLPLPDDFGAPMPDLKENPPETGA